MAYIVQLEYIQSIKLYYNILMIQNKQETFMIRFRVLFKKFILQEKLYFICEEWTLI